jgi:uncharacterized protein YecE (DUF72 family)
MVKVGCCGFPTSMTKYFKTYSMVELNSTFYQYPRENTVEGWRRKAPKNFEFTVKAHQDISHKARMKTGETSIQAFERMMQICKTLNSKILVFQTAGSFKPDRLQDAEKFFKEMHHENLILVWETRGSAWEAPKAFKKLRQVLKKLDITHVTDPFKIMPAYVSEVVYFRLHGLGDKMYYYQYDNVELEKLKEFISPFEKEGRKVYVLFNNLSMFEDGKRFMEYLSKGIFPRITVSTGLSSIKEVVEKTRYPISKSMLIKKLGWRLVEVGHEKQIRLEALLANLPPKIYKSAKNLIDDVKTTGKIA